MAQSSIEVQFEPGLIELEGRTPIKYEWALQQINDNYRLIFHFFLGLKHKDITFTMAMVDAATGASNGDGNTTTFEVFYTDMMDGHDLILNSVRNPFAKEALKNIVISGIIKGLEKQDERSNNKPKT